MAVYITKTGGMCLNTVAGRSGVRSGPDSLWTPGVSSTSTNTYLPILDYSSLPNYSFTRATPATFWNESTQTFYRFASGQARSLTLSGRSGFVFENAATNYCLWSHDHTQSAWTGTPTRVKDATGVDGVANSATRVTAAQNVRVSQTIAGFNNLDPCNFSLFVRTDGAPFTLRIWVTYKDGTTESFTDTTVTSTWTRHHAQLTSVGSGASNVKFSYAPINAGTFTFFVWGAQAEKTVGRTSLIEATTASVTRNADVMTGDIPSTLYSSPYALYWIPNDRNAWSVLPAYLLYKDASNYSRITTGGNIEVFVGGASKLSSSAKTWNAASATSMLFNPTSSSVTAAGFATGNGASSGTSWAAMPGTTTHIGNLASANAASGFLSNPYPS